MSVYGWFLAYVLTVCVVGLVAAVREAVTSR
jgi:hypothetical protein